MDSNDQSVATRLREDLAVKGWSIGELARQLRKDKSQVVKWVNGKHTPTGENARALARLLGRPDDYYVTPREQMPTQAERIAALEALGVEQRAAIRRLEQRLRRLGGDA